MTHTLGPGRSRTPRVHHEQVNMSHGHADLCMVLTPPRSSQTLPRGSSPPTLCLLGRQRLDCPLHLCWQGPCVYTEGMRQACSRHCATTPCLPWAQCPSCPCIPWHAHSSISGGDRRGWGMWASQAEVNGGDELLLEAERGAVGPPPHPATGPDDEKKSAPSTPHWCQKHPETKSLITHSSGEETEAGVSTQDNIRDQAPKPWGSLLLLQRVGTISLGPSLIQHGGWVPVSGLRPTPMPHSWAESGTGPGHNVCQL